MLSKKCEMSDKFRYSMFGLMRMYNQLRLSADLAHPIMVICCSFHLCNYLFCHWFSNSISRIIYSMDLYYYRTSDSRHFIFIDVLCREHAYLRTGHHPISIWFFDIQLKVNEWIRVMVMMTPTWQGGRRYILFECIFLYQYQIPGITS